MLLTSIHKGTTGYKLVNIMRFLMPSSKWIFMVIRDAKSFETLSLTYGGKNLILDSRVYALVKD